MLRYKLKIIVPALTCFAASLMLWNLGEKYLWQDEACTAVLAQRLLKFGKPLAFDGTNLITTDYFQAEDADTVGQRTGEVRAAIDYYVRRGDIKKDTSWKWQPWGQFVVAAISLKILGNNTLAARLPFALAGVATVLLLYGLISRYLDCRLIAILAAAMLVMNAYWVLHSRQCRYYSLSSLFLVLTLLAYAHWQWSGRRWGLFSFWLAAWGLFQVDYGTFWPICLVLFSDALLARPRHWKSLVGVGIVLALSIGPFVLYYELSDRLVLPMGTWESRFLRTIFNLNYFVVPVFVLMVALVFVSYRWLFLPSSERRLVVICIAVLTLLLLWVPTVAPVAFLRYIIIAAPLGSFLGAWLLVRIAHLLIHDRQANCVALLGAAILVLTPWASLPLNMTLPFTENKDSSTGFREELPVLLLEVFGSRPDPNRIVIDFLRHYSSTSDEILINYEDIPLMFYLPNPIRGGLSAFRVEDDSKAAPRFAIIRRSWPYAHWSAYLREMGRYQWKQVSVSAPDIPWGNNPDPWGMDAIAKIGNAPPLLILERL
jgi:hypothetical protein